MSNPKRNGPETVSEAGRFPLEDLRLEIERIDRLGQRLVEIWEAHGDEPAYWVPAPRDIDIAALMSGCTTRHVRHGERLVLCIPRCCLADALVAHREVFEEDGRVHDG